MRKNRILKKISNLTTRSCEMCKKHNPGGNWEYKPYQFTDYKHQVLIVCKQCIYKENYGSKTYRKAMKLKLLDKLNYDYSDTTPKVE